MSDEDPVRLKDQGSASPELVRALRALGTSSDAARLERVAQKLGATLAEGQPPMAASSAGLLGVKALVVGLVAAGIAALAWYGSGARSPAPERSSPPSEERAPAPPPQPPAAAEPSAPKAMTEAPAAPSPPSAPAKLPSRHAPSRARASAPASARASVEANPAPAAPAPASVGAANATATAAPNANNPAPAAPAPEDEAAHRPASSQPSAAAPATPPPSEAALLFGARKAVVSQPSAALRLLDRHAALYPDGLLAPEREVLRIETLRRLGRTAEADQRLRAFQARYPDSIHLRRLQQSEGGEH